MVKISQTIDIKGNYSWKLEIDAYDLIKAYPSLLASEAKKVYNATHKTSDLLMWLSEEVRAIEATESKLPSDTAETVDG